MKKVKSKNNKNENNNMIIIVIILLIILSALVVYKYYNKDINDIDIKFAENNVFIYNGKTYKYELINNDEYVEFCEIDYCNQCKVSINIEQIINTEDDGEIENRCFDENFDVSIKINKKLVKKILEHEKEKNK